MRRSSTRTVSKENEQAGEEEDEEETKMCLDRFLNSFQSRGGV